jgi:hypothetical protein
VYAALANGTMAVFVRDVQTREYGAGGMYVVTVCSFMHNSSICTHRRYSGGKTAVERALFDGRVRAYMGGVS